LKFVLEAGQIVSLITKQT